MQLSKAMKMLRDHEAGLRKMGITSLYLFGSTVRGEQRPDSDIDLFFEDDGTLGLFELMDIQEETSRILGCNADIMSRDSINKHIRPYAEYEAVMIF